MYVTMFFSYELLGALLILKIGLQEKITDPTAKSASHATNRSNGPPYAQSVITMESDDGISLKGWSYSYLSN